MTNQLNLKGKSVALVGPAKAVGDQSAEVQACDFIIRCNYRWNGHDPLAGYGERTDAAFYNIKGSKSVRNFPSLFQDIPWIILKRAAHPLEHPQIVQTKEPFEHANQIPILLNWLEPFEPSGVYVFGADFYTSGFHDSAQTEYRPDREFGEYWKAIRFHDQGKQHSWMSEFQDRTRLIKGDSRMVELLSLTTEEVIARLHEAWREYSG
jgi:hypothetical protein